MTTQVPQISVALQLHQQGDFPAAETAYRQILRVDPAHADALHLLGLVEHQNGRHAEAIHNIRRAITINGTNAVYYANLGAVEQALGNVDEAVTSFRRAIECKPGFVNARYNLGNALRVRGDLKEAEASFREVLEACPDHADALNNLGTILQHRHELEQAIACYRKAVASDPLQADAWSNLGVAYQLQKRLEDAEECGRQAVRVKPDFADAYNSLGSTLQAQCRLDEATANYRKAVELNPRHASAADNLLMALNYDPDADPEFIREEHFRWGGRRESSSNSILEHTNNRDPHRRLRIGYVSPDFRVHSVGYFVEPLLAHHDRQTVETFCYAEVPVPDETTVRLESLADHWRSTVFASDGQVAEMIRSDGIDILVDMAGRTARNRLGVFARKPAPVQVTYLGYVNTTGLRAVDYRLVDGWTDPAGFDRRCCEELVRLHGGFLCYRPPADVPDVAESPLQQNGYVTFGSFNNLVKTNARVIDLWSRLLHAIPRSGLILKTSSLRAPAVCERYREMFVERGIAPDRIELLGPNRSLTEHLATYARIDIALDPFPFAGTTTTCEAMWMGVPVVTLAGNTHAGRVGVSLLSRMGLPDLIADSPEDYLTIVRDLAADARRLCELRRSLRPAMSRTVCDATKFTRDLEGVYRQMWKRWCLSGKGDERRGA